MGDRADAVPVDPVAVKSFTIWHWSKDEIFHVLVSGGGSLIILLAVLLIRSPEGLRHKIVNKVVTRGSTVPCIFDGIWAQERLDRLFRRRPGGHLQIKTKRYIREWRGAIRPSSFVASEKRTKEEEFSRSRFGICVFFVEERPHFMFDVSGVGLFTKVCWTGTKGTPKVSNL